jgi:hypothetical protein
MKVKLTSHCMSFLRGFSGDVAPNASVKTDWPLPGVSPVDLEIPGYRIESVRFGKSSSDLYLEPGEKPWQSGVCIDITLRKHKFSITIHNLDQKLDWFEVDQIHLKWEDFPAAGPGLRKQIDQRLSECQDEARRLISLGFPVRFVATEAIYKDGSKWHYWRSLRPDCITWMDCHNKCR